MSATHQGRPSAPHNYRGGGARRDQSWSQLNTNMSHRLEAELEKLDPSVPFRATRTHLHHTWAKTFHARPELYIRPESLEEIQKIVTVARRCRRRIVVVGCGHSPSDLTCTSAWMVNLDRYNRVLNMDKEKKTMTVQGGIRLRDLNLRAKEYGLTMPNLGSIDQQSIVGAIATATHGSSTQHGLLSQSVRSLRIVLANGSAVRCSATQQPDLFRAALVSLGALGIIVEVEYEMIDFCNIEWEQTLKPLSYVLEKWEKDLWTTKEFTRIWWLPYMKRAIVWQANKTQKPCRPPKSNWYGGSIGYHTYRILLYIANYIPAILPAIEWFVFGMQYGFADNTTTTAIEEQRTGLLMNCLYSQFVNEWAIPLHRGPEALTRLSAWLNGDEKAARIPVSSKRLWIHAPIEVRVSDTTATEPRPFLDNTPRDRPTLYLNATLYRAYNTDPPCTARYYEAFEYLMKELGGRPHWAKNFSYVSQQEFAEMYGEDLEAYLRVRNEVDPEGMFVGEWHRKNILPDELPLLPLEEREIARRPAKGGGVDWVGEQAAKASPKSSSSEESFDILHGAEAEASLVLERLKEEASTEDERENLYTEVHGSVKEGMGGIEVFNKM